MSELRIQELEAQLLAANETAARLTKANADLTTKLADSELQNKRIRRNSRRDSSDLHQQIATLHSRRG